jgi:uncharacterized protein (DUF1330 family)
MPAYAVSQIRWEDAHGPERYVKLVQQALNPFGGKYLAFAPASVIEGSMAPAYIAIVEFPSLDAAKQFYESEQYRLARKIRAISAKTDWLCFVDGLNV